MSGLAPANSESAIVPTSNVLISPGAAQAPNLVQKATQQLHQTGGLVNARMSMVSGNGDAASTEEVSKRIEGGTQITQNFLDSLGDEKKVIGALKDRRDALLASAVSASAASTEESLNMNDGAAAVHGSALVVGSSYRWCAAGSGGWALAPITGTAGAGLGCPGVRPFRVEDDDASMTSAAVAPDVFQTPYRYVAPYFSYPL